MRTIGDRGESFRVRVTTPRRDGLRVSYLGPYATLGTAKAQLTNAFRYTYPRPASAVIERAATVWEEVLA